MHQCMYTCASKCRHPLETLPGFAASSSTFESRCYTGPRDHFRTEVADAGKIKIQDNVETVYQVSNTIQVREILEG